MGAGSGERWVLPWDAAEDLACPCGVTFENLTRMELAWRADITAAYVSLLESGKKKNPSLEILQRLAKALGVSVTELLE